MFGLPAIWQASLDHDEEDTAPSEYNYDPIPIELVHPRPEPKQSESDRMWELLKQAATS